MFKYTVHIIAHSYLFKNYPSFCHLAKYSFCNQGVLLLFNCCYIYFYTLLYFPLGMMMISCFVFSFIDSFIYKYRNLVFSRTPVFYIPSPPCCIVSSLDVRDCTLCVVNARRVAAKRNARAKYRCSRDSCFRIYFYLFIFLSDIFKTNIILFYNFSLIKFEMLSRSL